MPLESGKYTVWTLDENGCEAISEPLEVDLINSVSNHLPLGWKLYPNPAADWLVLELPGVADGVFVLYDLAGRMVLEGVLEGGGRRLDLKVWGWGVCVGD
ncbi:MAG: hypothetical protein IPJ00_20735 [Saprospirales bacterium]|nr:hypothetical protein [Saprospirales bacterium]